MTLQHIILRDREKPLLVSTTAAIGSRRVGVDGVEPDPVELAGRYDVRCIPVAWSYLIAVTVHLDLL